MNFWENLTRYPRFFISSCFGLILVILTPFRQFTKTLPSTILVILLLLLLIIFLTISLFLMLNSE